MKKYLVIAALLFASIQVSAHALWIETAPSGAKGKAQDVKVFYGEYAEFSPEKVSDWYSDVKDFSLWLIGPDGGKTQLPVREAADHFAAAFTPEKDGIYTLLVSHSAKDLGGKTIYQFNTSATVSVGKSNNYNITAANTNPIKFNLSGLSKNKTSVVTGYFNEKPAGDMYVTVFSPKGWTKQLQTNAEGKAEFTPEWSGTYLIEISRSDKETGEHHGKPYEGIWRCATYLVEIK